jgi:outer membrane protein assembly factor BamB
LVVTRHLPRRGGQVPVRRLVLIAVIAALAVVAGAAIMFQIRGWAALENESGRVCGTGGSPCPGREVPALVASFVVGLAAAALLIWILVRGRKVYYPAVAAAGLAVGVFAGQALSGAPPADLRVDWTAAHDSAGAQAAEGVWTTGDSLIRVSAGQIVSYQAGTGRRQWTLAVPGGNVVCAVSPGTAPVPRAPGAPGQLAGLIGFGAAGGACDHVLAVNLGTGRPLWSGPVGARWRGNQGTGFLAAGGGTAVAVIASGALGYNLRTGVPRWTARTPVGCADQMVATGTRAVVVLASCKRSFAVISLDLASGRQLWRASVPEPAPGYQFAVLSADPLVVDNRLPGGQGDHLLAFTPSGRVAATIPVPGLDTSDYQGSGPEIAISGGLLAGVTKPSGGHAEVVAYRLADGRRLWRVPMPDDVVAIRQDGGRLLVLDRSAPDLTLDAITIASGSLRVIGHVSPGVVDPGGTSVYPAGGHYLMVNLTGRGSVPAAAALGG